MGKIFLSIVIPCYNEEENLKRNVLSELKEFLSQKNFTWEVIVSDDGSTDESRNLAKRQIKEWTNFSVLINKHGGKPSALWEGVKKAAGEYILFTDMDQSTPIGEIDKLLPLTKKNFAAIIGSRGMSRKNFPIYRRLGSIVFMSLRKTFILPDINDTQCGFKLFKRDVVLEVFPKLEFFRKRTAAHGWKVTSYDVELLHIIEKMGEKIKEVKVNWKDTDKSVSKGGGLSRYFRESREMFSQILRVKFNDLKGFYKLQ